MGRRRRRNWRSPGERQRRPSLPRRGRLPDLALPWITPAIENSNRQQRGGQQVLDIIAVHAAPSDLLRDEIDSDCNLSGKKEVFQQRSTARAAMPTRMRPKASPLSQERWGCRGFPR